MRHPVLASGGPLGAGGFDIVGLGQAMVDFSGMVPASFLQAKQVEKGGRRVINVDERAAMIEELKAEGFQLNAGGSLANTLSGCAQLGRAAFRFHSGATVHTRVGMAGCVGDDHLGEFFKSQFSNAGVEWIGAPTPGTGTGTVVVLTTPDAQRSFLSYPGTSVEFAPCAAARSAIRSARVLVIEGYLWEFPNAAANIAAAIAVARGAGAVIAMTMADVSVVTRHREAMLGALKSVDIVFTNAAEAAALVGPAGGVIAAAGGTPFGAESAALQLGCLCPVAVVTDGSHGSCITAMGQLHVVPPDWSKDAPVDTTGAGDAYAAGFLFGYLSGMPVRKMGEFAAATASCVISHRGPQLLQEHADHLISLWPALAEDALPLEQQLGVLVA